MLNLHENHSAGSFTPESEGVQDQVRSSHFFAGAFLVEGSKMPIFRWCAMADEKANSEAEAEDAIRCAVVGDSRMVLQMLCSILRSVPRLRVVAAATSLRDIERVSDRQPLDLLVSDARAAGDRHSQPWKNIFETRPSLKCIVLTEGRELFECPANVSPAVLMTVDKSESLESLLAAVRNCCGGGSSFATGVPDSLSLAKLTKREREVFAILGDGMSNKEIAKELSISVQTVETHRKSISRKMGCNGATLIRLAALSRDLCLP